MSNVPPLLNSTDHRPFPVPDAPWVMKQSWSKLLFAHWPVKSELLREHVPAMLEIDTHENSAWIGVIPFAMRGVRPRYTVEMPGMSNFLELNVRTYVVKDGIPGVYFFSLDCSNPVAVFVARKFYHLPYYNATMKLSSEDHAVKYYSRRAASGAVFDGSYQPQGPIFKSSPGSIERFLTERYCLYTTDQNGQCYRGVIHHEMWPLQSAEAEIRANDLVQKQLGITLPNVQPLLHYSENIDTVEWPLQKLT
jgi:uncharacterized protein